MSAENATDEKHDQVEHGGSEEQEARKDDGRIEGKRHDWLVVEHRKDKIDKLIHNDSNNDFRMLHLAHTC